MEGYVGSQLPVPARTRLGTYSSSSHLEPRHIDKVCTGMPLIIFNSGRLPATTTCGAVTCGQQFEVCDWTALRTPNDSNIRYTQSVWHRFHFLEGSAVVPDGHFWQKHVDAPSAKPPSTVALGGFGNPYWLKVFPCSTTYIPC